MSLRRIAALTGALGLCVMSGCASTRGAWENARRLDTIEAYEDFAHSHPIDAYSDSARVRIAVLMEAMLESQKRAEREKLERVKTLATDNERRMTLLKSYQPGVTTEQVFLADRWTAGDLAKGRIGIIAKSTAGTRTQYTMAVVPGIVQDPEAAKLMDSLLGVQERFATEGAPSGNYKTNITGATELCSLAFEHGLLVTARWAGK